MIEQETIGWGASSRNGGMATPGIKRPIKDIVENYGEEKARAFWQASLDAIDLLEEIVTTEGIDCDWRRRGQGVGSDGAWEKGSSRFRRLASCLAILASQRLIPFRSPDSR